MAQWTEDVEAMAPSQKRPSRFPKMLTLPEVKDILNVGMPALRALVASGELRGAQLTGKHMWRVSEDGLADYLERACTETQERIAAGSIRAETLEGED
jgi:excisionase family DNA binding protein